MTPYYDAATIEPASQVPSAFSDIYFDSVSGMGASQAILLRGLPEMPMDHIVMQNCSLTAGRTLEITDVSNLVLNNVQLTAPDNQ